MSKAGDACAVIVAPIVTATEELRVESSAPHAYRLVRRGHEYVLQGCCQWRQGEFSGTEWRDLPTVGEQGGGA